MPGETTGPSDAERGGGKDFGLEIQKFREQAQAPELARTLVECLEKTGENRADNSDMERIRKELLTNRREGEMDSKSDEQHDQLKSDFEKLGGKLNAMEEEMEQRLRGDAKKQ